MKRVTTDRGDIVHLAGFHRLSPALDAQGQPAFSSEPGDGLARCGWERFFAALRERRLAVESDPDDPAPARLVPAATDTPHAHPGHGGAGAVEHSRRFWKALFPGRSPRGDG